MSRGAPDAGRKNTVGSGYARAALDSPLSESAATSRPSRAAFLPHSPAQGPLHSPHFPIAADHGLVERPPVSASGRSYSALPVSSPADSAVVDLGVSRRLGPHGELHSALSPDEHAGLGRDSDTPAEKTPDAAIEQAAAIELAAAAAVAATTPPQANEERWYREQIDYVRNQVEQMENSEMQRDQMAKNMRSKWRRRLFLLFEDPSSSPTAFVINVFLTFMIILSAVLTTIETIPALRKGHATLWLVFELTIVVVFTIEFVLRFLGHTDTWRQAWGHTKSLVTIVDALAIFPFYIELILQRDTSYEFRFTILRIFRLLRVFSAFKYSSLLQLSIEVMIVAIKRSADALLAFLLFVTLTVLLFSALMYFAERGTWDEERQAFLTPDGEYSKFSSIPAAAYYSIVTLTTTGFGDMVPTTFIGKLVSFPMMIAGILLIALPSIIVGRNFTQVWEAARKLRTSRPAARQSAPGESLVDNDDDASEARASVHSSRKVRRRRLRRRAAARRSGSISSFEAVSARSERSPREHASGYTGITGGQQEFGGNDDGTRGIGFYAAAADPIDALARKDSIEMQELVLRHAAEADIQSEGYKPLEAIYSSDSNDDDGGDGNGSPEGLLGDRKKVSRASWRKEGPSTRPSPRLAVNKRASKGKERAESQSTGDTVAVSQLEWLSLKAEVAALRTAISGNENVLQAIANHLSIPNHPPAKPM
ncbi:hypothetical protein LPJ61_002039 [Coemansia biformis]|uniref:Ion transport domain-containing protein n=1 Tax=Coemansia biformis TaxID=1286918 RepID=A0A9W7YFA7_9FUNG|nr:hypothetical protein LPJ61_002039 [Coemansia biformis]